MVFSDIYIILYPRVVCWIFIYCRCLKSKKKEIESSAETLKRLRSALNELRNFPGVFFAFAIFFIIVKIVGRYSKLY